MVPLTVKSAGGCEMCLSCIGCAGCGPAIVLVLVAGTASVIIGMK